MKFVHIADVHLGAAPDVGYPWNETRQQEIWDSFRRVIDRIKEEGTDLLLISGDLFHGQPLVRELKEVSYLFGGIPDTTVVLIAGNHDYLKADSHYRTFAWPENVICLWEDHCVSRYIPHIQTYVYGMSYVNREMLEPVYNQTYDDGATLLESEHADACHILVAHGGDEKHIPINVRKLADVGFDYIALGHIHKPQILQENAIAYAGALEPLDKNDIGKHGYIKGTFADGKISAHFVEAACRSYCHEEIQIDTATTQLSLADQIRGRLQECGTDNIYKFTLVGYRDADVTFALPQLKTLGNIVEIVDETQPDYDFDRLLEQYEGTLIGKFIESFPGEGRTRVESKALYYGLQAMLEAKK